MITEPPPFQGLNIKIPIIIPIHGNGFIHLGSGLHGGGGSSLMSSSFPGGSKYPIIRYLGFG